MANARLEHLNITVSDPRATAAWIERIFGWKVRWEGPALNNGYTIHVGTEDGYVALYSPGEVSAPKDVSYTTKGGFNHWSVVVDDLDATEALIKAEGFTTENHADYEPGRRFYFHDHDGVEVEVVQYD